MTPLVLDASVVAKLFFPEDKSDSAKELVESAVKKAVPLYAPALLFIEIASVAWKKCRLGEMGSKDAASVIQALQSFPLEFIPLDVLSAPALEIALHTGCTPYDGVYIALADAVGGVVKTADAGLVKIISRTVFAKYVSLI
ncbi:MAG: type II toxin-antitoxin system VapC family toxin [Deltaproteobacteria bacterium]|nr:type II toxin-antitoxin system VapC family toxin [Deltaproteobacteria bacterium]